MTATSGFGVVLSGVQIAYYCVGIVVAIGAVLTYRSNSQRERAKWAVQLYEKFYETKHYKQIRDAFDCASDAPSVVELVGTESSDFTDYLNFFEMVTSLVEAKQLSEKDVFGLFQYYLRCLKQHTEVMKYLNDRGKGFEQLREFLNKPELQ